MPCAVSVTAIQGERSDEGVLQTIHVEGTATGCDQVQLELSCAGATGIETRVWTVDTSSEGGGWEIAVDPPDCAACGKLLTVKLTCLTAGVIHPECEPAQLQQPLWCSGCPRVEVEVVPGDCSYEDVGDTYFSYRHVTFRVRIDAPSGTVVRSSLEAGDGRVSAERTSRDYTVTYAYDTRAGTARPSLRISEPASCPTVEIPTVVLQPCPPRPDVPAPTPRCPGIDRLDATVTALPGGGCAIVWLVVFTFAQGPGRYTWRTADGSEHTSDVPTFTQIVSGDDSFYVEVTFDPDGPCPTIRGGQYAQVEGCDAADGGPGEDTLCWIGRAAIGGLFAGALAALVLSLCLPEPFATNARVLVGVYGLAAVVLLVLWLALCEQRPCRWALLLFGQMFLGAGIILASVTPCCPAGGLVGAAFIGVGAGMLLGWRAECGVGWCTLAQELAKTWVALIVPGLGLAGATGCFAAFAGEPFATGLVLAAHAVFAVLTLYALGCDESPPDLEPHRMPDITLPDRVPPAPGP